MVGGVFLAQQRMCDGCVYKEARWTIEKKKRCENCKRKIINNKVLKYR